MGGDSIGDGEGTSVASSAEGSIVAIGAPEHNRHSGRVRVYEYKESTDNWMKIGGDIVGEYGDESGFSVALSITGDFLAVGSPKCSIMGKTESGEDATLKEVGCVRVYERTSELGIEGQDTWEQLGDTLTGKGSFDQFGYSVAINDIYTDVENEDLDMVQIAIGAPGARNALDQIVGRVYMKEFIVDEGSMTWNDASRNVNGQLFVGEGTDGSRFGTSVDLSIDNDLIVVGAPKTDNTKFGADIRNAGAVFLYERTRNVDTVQRWGKVESFTQYGDDADDECGTSVSMTLRGTFIAFGCPYASFYDMDDKFIRKPGMVEVFKIKKTETQWSHESVGTDDLYGSNSGDFFGYSLDIGEDSTYGTTNLFLAVGSPNAYPSSSKQKAGHVRVFHKKDGLSSWYRANLDIDGWNSFDEFGTSVAVSYDGHRVVGGGPGRSGYAKVFGLKYTEAPTMAPTRNPTSNRRPSTNSPPHKMDDLIYDRKKSSPSPFLLTLLFLVLIPAMAFLVFRGYLYWRARHQYNSQFGSDVRVANPSDLELTTSVGNVSGTPGAGAGAASAPAPARDII